MRKLAPWVAVSVAAAAAAFAGAALAESLGVKFTDRTGSTSTDAASAPLLAASIFLDILNVFLFFLQIFTQDER